MTLTSLQVYTFLRLSIIGLALVSIYGLIHYNLPKILSKPPLLTRGEVLARMGVIFLTASVAIATLDFLLDFGDPLIRLCALAIGQTWLGAGVWFCIYDERKLKRERNDNPASGQPGPGG